MEAVDKYKEMVDEVGHMLYVFANFKDYPFKDLVKEQGWTLENIKKMQVRVQHFGDITKQIKDELVGDGDEAKFMGRLKTAFFELGADPYFAPSYFPVFDEALFELPSKDEPDRNKEMVEALVSVYGEEAGKVMLSLRVIVQWANIIVEEVSKMLDEVCKFVGYTPELQEQPEPQQGGQEEQPPKKDLHYYCQKAIEKGYLVKDGEGYRRVKWSKAQLAYFLKHFPKANGDFNEECYDPMFRESRLSKAANQLMNNKNGDGKPKGYEIVDKLLEG